MIDNDIALRNVSDILLTLQDCGAPAWVQDGTLLGLIRNGRTIPWDHDTDTGTHISSWSAECHQALEQAGFTLEGVLGAIENGLQHRWTRDGVKTDIFFYYTNPDSSIWHAAYLSNTRQYRFTYPAFGLAPIETTAGPMLAPDPPELFLVTKYGEDWRTPKRRWHFAGSPLNHTRMDK
jgi:hypothetical protein